MKQLRWLFFLLPLLACHCGNNPSTPSPPLIICDQNDSGITHNNADRFGFFSESLYDSNYSDTLDRFTKTFGTKPGFILWYQPIYRIFPNYQVNINAARSIKTVISLDITDSLQNTTVLGEIVLGKWDSILTVFAQQAFRAGGFVCLRFGYEMNIPYHPWSMQPNDFVAAWNHAHQIFVKAKATNVRWIFSPGILYGSMTFSGDILPYYPGDSVVDIVSLDGYNYGDNYNAYHHWQSFRDVFGTSLIAIKSLGKPIWISEVGCPTDPRRPAWLQDLLGFMDDNPCVGSFLWFDDHKTNEPDFRLESDSASLAIMKGWLAR